MYKYKIGKNVNFRSHRRLDYEFEFVINGQDGEMMEWESKEDAIGFLKKVTGEELTLDKYEEDYGYYVMYTVNNTSLDS